MSHLKSISILTLLAVFFTSCSDRLDTVYFFSKEELKNNLTINLNSESSQRVLNSTTLSLKSSDFFNKNLEYLRNVEVTKMRYIIKNLDGNIGALSNLQLFLNDISITEDLDIKNLDTKNKNIQLEVINPLLLSKISLLLLNEKSVIISYKNDANDSKSLHINLEFLISINGTFKDY